VTCWRRFALLAAALLSPGCASTGYLLHAARGQLEVLSARRPIDEVIADPATTAQLSRRLEQVRAMREFAATELALPTGDSYRQYADVGRAYPVWSLNAAPALSLVPRSWCYPVVGCLSYRGYFDLALASEASQRLRDQGLDVYVAPVPAYSTLGWFDDPVFDSLLRGPPWYTAGIVFHELAHRRLYVPGDTAFSEAYAVSVQREGERRWLAEHGTEATRTAYRRYRAAHVEFLRMVRQTRSELEAIYASAASDERKLERKARSLRALRGRFAQMPARLEGYRGFDRWFGQDVNNAKLAQVATYNALVPRFEALMRRLDGDMRRFHREVERLARLNFEARRAALPSVP